MMETMANDSDCIDLYTRTKVFEEVIISRVKQIQGILRKNNQKVKKNQKSVDELKSTMDHANSSPSPALKDDIVELKHKLDELQQNLDFGKLDMLSSSKSHRVANESFDLAVRKFENDIEAVEQSMKLMINQRQLENVT